MITIEESGMTFGPFHEDHFFHIEKCNAYLEIQNKVKMVEFILNKQNRGGDQIWLIEAKQSAPRQENKDDWANYLGELKEKFENRLSLFIALCLKRHTDPEFRELLKGVDLGKIKKWNADASTYFGFAQ